ncbi:ABC transport system permease protein [Paenibacillus sp. JCM 10914]|nr:ABC transport system permease protein [Paenibacillus sp. JCM 10914]
MLYKHQHTDNELQRQWDAFVAQSESSGMVFEPVNENTDGRVEAENNRATGYVELSQAGIVYYGNPRNPIESDIAETLMYSFADRYKLVSAFPDIVMPEQAITDNVREMKLDGGRQPSAMDYYAIAMITMIILYGSLTAANLIEGERTRNTATRLLAAPVTKAEIFTGKIAGSVLQNLLAVAVVVFVCKFMFNVYWGEHLGLVFLVLLSQIIFALSLGLGFSYLFKGNVATTLLITIIHIGAFFGGSYFPLEDVTGVLRILTYFSPLQWTNEALLQIIYENNISALGRVMMLNIGFSVVLLGSAILIMRKREGL